MSTVPSKTWSPDHRTPVLLSSSAIVQDIRSMPVCEDRLSRRGLHTIAIEQEDLRWELEYRGDILKSLRPRLSTSYA